MAKPLVRLSFGLTLEVPTLAYPSRGGVYSISLRHAHSTQTMESLHGAPPISGSHPVPGRAPDPNRSGDSPPSVAPGDRPCASQCRPLRGGVTAGQASFA